MNKSKSYNNAAEFFAILNKHDISYAVLRNYDNLLSDELYMEGHGDIDLLCDDSSQLAKVVGAAPQEFHMKNGQSDGTHYYIYIKGKYCSLDLRHFGDGYYYEKWEKDMVAKRVLHGAFYVLHPEDYFYSLIYHAVFQKPKFSSEYRLRLIEMANELNIKIKNGTQQEFIRLLESFMVDKNYSYVYPQDRYVPLKTKRIQNKSLLLYNYRLWKQHFLFDTKVKAIEILVQVKHLVFKKK